MPPAWIGWGTAAIVLVILVLLPLRSAWIASIAIVSVGLAAVTVAILPRRSPSTTGLEAQYQHACAESQQWLEKWSELFTLSQTDAELRDHDESLLLAEALAGAADAAADAIARRDDYAHRFIANGFDRLGHVEITNVSDVPNAIAVIERYLDTLWIDPHAATLARNRLEQVRPDLRRQQVLQVAGSIRLLDGGQGQPGTDLDHERFRLRAERVLLRESPLTQATFNDDDL